MKRKALPLTFIVIICLIVAGSISVYGRRWFATISTSMKAGKPQPASTSAPAAAQGPANIAQAASAAHNWNKYILDSIVSGTITYYDITGNQTVTGSITIYRRYPDLLKVVIDWDGSTEVYGVDDRDSWVQGATTISNEDARDVRAFLRIWPERLFVAYDLGAPYSEMGQHVQDYKPIAPKQDRVDLETLLTFHELEVEDTIGREKPETRKVYYSVNTTNSRVNALHYLEPDNPEEDMTDPETERTEIRVEFDNWQTINNVLWPFDIFHWYGGKVDYQIKITQVLTNQNLSNEVFQQP
jgi:hypothetical protein